MQNSLFGDEPAPPGKKSPKRSRETKPIGLAAEAEAFWPLAAQLPPGLRLGTSSWYFPGWAGLVWDARHPLTQIRREGLSAYAQHPLLRTVSLDRGFYKPLSVEEYATYAAQVPDGFRFMVKAPSRVADASIRGAGGRGARANPDFLDPQLAVETFAQPALRGLGDRLGVLLFQLSPIASKQLTQTDPLLEALQRMLSAVGRVIADAPNAIAAVELRNAELLDTPHAAAFAATLRDSGAHYCLGLHPKMPPVADQLAFRERLPPGPLLCRWNLHRKHGAYGYEEAKRLYGDFDQLVDPDPDTRTALARAIAKTSSAGYAVYVAIGNKAEGSAPLSVIELAKEIAATSN